MPAVAFRTSRGWLPPAANFERIFEGTFDSTGLSHSNDSIPVNTFGRQYGDSTPDIANIATANTVRSMYDIRTSALGILGLPVGKGGSAFFASRAGCGSGSATKSGATANSVPGATTTPRGDTSVWDLKEATGTSEHYANYGSAQNGNVTTAQGTQFGVYLKEGTRRYALVYAANASDVSSPTGIGVDLQTGAVTDVFGLTSPDYFNYKVWPVVNGWYYVWVSIQPDAGTGSTNRGWRISISNNGTYASRSYAGSTSNYIYVWGHSAGPSTHANQQMRVSCFPGINYDNNSAESPGTLQEYAEWTVSGFNVLQTHVIYQEVLPVFYAPKSIAVSANGSPEGEPWGVMLTNTSGVPRTEGMYWTPRIGGRVNSGGGVVSAVGTVHAAFNSKSWPIGEKVRMAIRFGQNDVAVVANGTLMWSNTVFTVPNNLTRMYFGDYNNFITTTYGKGGILQKVRYWNNVGTNFSNAQLITMTTPPP